MNVWERRLLVACAIVMFGIGIWGSMSPPFYGDEIGHALLAQLLIGIGVGMAFMVAADARRE